MISGYQEFCAVYKDGSLVCLNPFSNFKNDAIEDKNSTDIKFIECSLYKSCVINKSNYLRCWS